MDISKENWKMVRDVCNKGLDTNSHLSLGTVNEDGSPNIAPVGSFIFLEYPGKAFFFDKFFTTTSKNIDRDPRICVIGVNSGFLFWMNSLRRGYFSSPPGIRLTGIAGQKREATDKERAMWLDKVKTARRTKGYKILWADMKHIRDVEFKTYELGSVGEMTPQYKKQRV
ncbi:pyridoxamine 5'-phosphate oxidase family protein [Candidatus Desantisbacteria bacterium]|nr:pyridoxamine 5'-phosphate oxidase family protein [Candidatus Desantisbacteria bacterium]